MLIGYSLDDFHRYKRCREDKAITIAGLRALDWRINADGPWKYTATTNPGYPKTGQYWSYKAFEDGSASKSWQWIDHDSGLIFAKDNTISPRSLTRWSHLNAAIWKDKAINDDQIKGLRRIIRENIENDIFLLLLKEVNDANLIQGDISKVPWRIDPETDVYQAFLDSPDAKGLAWLLVDEPLLHHLVIDYMVFSVIYPNRYSLHIYLKEKDDE